MKPSLAKEEALTSEVVAQAHVEDVGLKLFEYADNEDKSSHFHKYVHILYPLYMCIGLGLGPCIIMCIAVTLCHCALHRNMIKAFFTCSHVFSLLNQFGDLTEEVPACIMGSRTLSVWTYG